jgi:hypothetical protein
MVTSTVSRDRLCLSRAQAGHCHGTSSTTCPARSDRMLDAAMHDAVPAIAACGVSPIVRIPDNQGYMVKSK